MVSHKNYNLNANEGFVIFLTSKLIPCLSGSFTSKMKSQSIVYLFNGCEHIYVYIYIWFWIFKMKCTQYGLYGQSGLQSMQGQFYFGSRAEWTGSMGFIRAMKEVCLEWGPTLSICDLTRGVMRGSKNLHQKTRVWMIMELHDCFTLVDSIVNHNIIKVHNNVM